MDFGEILNKWERQGKGSGAFDKDAREQILAERKKPGSRRARLLRKTPDASIDLHGLTRDEAWTALEVFFENSRRNGFEKLQIIHGKGNHRSEEGRAFTPGSVEYGGDEGILKDLSRRFIERCTFAGESGYNSAKEGGSGATWVILKEKNEVVR